MAPNARITSVLADVHSWIGFANAFTHLHTGMPADDPRVVLTGVLADATNLGLTRMAEACSVTNYRELAWTAGWHLREDTYRQALAMVVDAQQRQPLAARFGFADVSSSDGQAFLTAGRCPAWSRARAIRVVLHPRLVPPCAVPHGIHSALGRSGIRHRRAALSRGRSQHCRPSYGRRRRERPRLRLGASLGLPFRPAHPQPRGPQTLRLRPRLDLVRSGTVHRRAPGRKADHGTMERRAPAGGLGANGHGQCLVNAQAPPCLSPAERVGAGIAGNRAHRTNPSRTELA